jgi:hypothetical protein
VKIFSSKRRVTVSALILLALLFLLRPGASRLKWRIVSSISSGVGRPVTIGSVHLRLLPRPGFDLENLVVSEDPAFGAEPMLRASEVTASLRLISLARGRIEIARLDLTDPSLNLVRAENGRWNLEALLERTAHTPLAPTGKAKSEPRTGFPYIEASSARINFKYGAEKKPYALTNADFSLWQDSENSWGVRLKAQPFRSDMNLNDTGILQLNGTWQRADVLRETPLQFRVEWSRAQLGQVTKFVSGNDQGWRGTVQMNVNLEGTPAKLQVVSDASVQDFHRYDILNGETLRLAMHCIGQYSSLNHALHGLDCNAPAEGGVISLQGDIGLPGTHSLGLSLRVQNVPASAALALVERAKKNLPEDLVAGGMVNGNLSIQEDAAAPLKLQVEGRGEISDFRLASAASKAEFGSETVPFRFVTDLPPNAVSRKRAAETPVLAGPHVEFGPFPVAIGHGAMPTIRGWIDRRGYDISIAGEADIAKTVRAARMVGLPALQTAAEGTAQIDLQIGGSWAAWSYGASPDFIGPRVTGTAKLHNVRVEVRRAVGPVEISSAEMQLLPDEVRLGKLSAKAAGTFWTGSLQMPRGCGTPGACLVHFSLNADQISLRDLNEWVSPRLKERSWYQVLGLSNKPAPSFLASVRAAGHLATEQLQLHNLAAGHVAANISLDGGKLRISDLTADILGGKHTGEWQADFSVTPGVCSGSGALTDISLARIANAANTPWIGGSAKASYEMKGECPADFWTSAEGAVRFDVRDSTLPYISLGEDAGPLKIARFGGQARLYAGVLEIKDAKLDSASGTFLVNGTASFKREIELRLVQPAGASGTAYTITGTLAEPQVTPVAGTEQARLKP